MDLRIRKEEFNDFKAVFTLVEEAFKEKEYSDHTEQFLVERLRSSDTFIPELSLVAEVHGKLVGHILLTKIKVKNDFEEFKSLAMAPVSVLPKFQGQGIGGKLILKAHNTAKKLGYESIILLGHKEYYSKFGYQQLDGFQISLPFDVPKENCMALELVKNALFKVNGVVEYPKAFFDG